MIQTEYTEYIIYKYSFGNIFRWNWLFDFFKIVREMATSKNSFLEKKFLLSQGRIQLNSLIFGNFLEVPKWVFKWIKKWIDIRGKRTVIMMMRMMMRLKPIWNRSRGHRRESNHYTCGYGRFFCLRGNQGQSRTARKTADHRRASQRARRGGYLQLRGPEIRRSFCHEHQRSLQAVPPRHLYASEYR